MKGTGISSNPLRIAIVGSGPTGFYTADHLFRAEGLEISVDMFDRLPVPFGLVRYGVAPDHLKIKSVTNAYDKVASHPGFRFFGNVEFGKDLFLDDLMAHYHQIVFCTGAQTDRKLNIPGEDLEGSHPATEFVAWYNGHPDFRDSEFDLTQEAAAVVGVGNVAIDVARILSRSVDELKATDIADYALEVLSESRVKEIYLIGRRGPAQAKFTNPELKEVGNLKDADVFTLPQEVVLDPLSAEALAKTPDRATEMKLNLLQEYSRRQPTGKSRRLHIRFLVSPTELYGDSAGRVTRMQLVRNELFTTEAGSIQSRPTEEFEEIPAGLVFRSIGYKGVPLPEIPFNENWGVILNEKGRVIDPASRQPIPGLYTAGWIKRGPTGVIGTNKPDALETVEGMLRDLKDGRLADPAFPDPADALALVEERQPDYLTYDDWRTLDQLEIERGRLAGRPRVKFTQLNEMLVALGRQPAVVKS
ncbi:MAG TPA: FAD-dependent oxidoreductase [Anaerolineales bacterium]|nr:FAD-dependent oxidoreductase [Anaerolineales bacterium]